jgi:hypothetical protein
VKRGLALLLLLTLAGCGGGATRESFVEDATVICQDVEQRIKALGAPQSFTDTQLYARRAKDAVSDGIGDLGELTPPPELEDAFARYLGTLEQRRLQLDLLAEAADGNSMRAIQEVGSELDVVNAKAKQEARAAGIADCEA